MEPLAGPVDLATCVTAKHPTMGPTVNYFMVSFFLVKLSWVYKLLILFADKVMCHKISAVARSTDSHFTCLEPQSNQSQHKTNGALVHSNRRVNHLLLYDDITLPGNKSEEYVQILTLKCKKSSYKVAGIFFGRENPKYTGGVIICGKQNRGCTVSKLLTLF